MKFIEQNEINRQRGLSPIPEKFLYDAKDVIRFEVQCKAPKIYHMSCQAAESGNPDLNKYKDLLTPEVCQKIVADYYGKTIGRGDWFTLQAARKQIEWRGYHSQKKRRLIHVLEAVNRCRSVSVAKGNCARGAEIDAFKRTLQDLSIRGINPVTIPADWGVTQIQNLLDAYFIQKKQEERWKEQLQPQLDKEIKKMFAEGLLHLG